MTSARPREIHVKETRSHYLLGGTEGYHVDRELAERFIALTRHRSERAREAGAG
ncbi:hypothetical protein [Spirillospora sp. CA-294931]|uniref:hypothetical protein n=1 Tax=Spirillospora sp. CA-294931 TaxID=3240042 RepID=UPI003D8A6D6A